jgi:hypothetical protein
MNGTHEIPSPLVKPTNDELYSFLCKWNEDLLNEFGTLLQTNQDLKEQYVTKKDQANVKTNGHTEDANAQYKTPREINSGFVKIPYFPPGDSGSQQTPRYERVEKMKADYKDLQRQVLELSAEINNKNVEKIILETEISVGLDQEQKLNHDIAEKTQVIEMFENCWKQMK